MSDIPMTDEECRLASEALSDQLDRYASLLVRKGCAIREGQELAIFAPVERADFSRRLVSSAYAAGAGHVTVIWGDDDVTPARKFHAPVRSDDVH